MPRPITDNSASNVSDDSAKIAVENNTASAAEPAAVKEKSVSDEGDEGKKTEDSGAASESNKDVVVEGSAAADENSTGLSENGDTKAASAEQESGSKIQVKVSPITAAVAGPPKKEKLVLSKSKVMDYLIKLFSKINSYEFRTELGKFSVMGDKFKILLSSPIRSQMIDKNGAKAQSVISTVYVDRKLKTATGYCEGKDTGLRRECEKNDLLDVPRDLPFYEFNIKLPEDWLWELIETPIDFVETDKYYVNSQKAIRVFFSLNNSKLDVFFDEKTGLPIRIIDIKDGKSSTNDFLDLNANSVKERDVVHRDLNSIPSEEYYYK